MPDHPCETDERAGEYRCVGEQTETLVEQQSGQAAWNETDRALFIGVGEGGIGCAVDVDKEPDPADRTECRKGKEGHSLSRSVAIRAQPEQDERTETSGKQGKAGVD